MRQERTRVADAKRHFQEIPLIEGDKWRVDRLCGLRQDDLEAWIRNLDASRDLGETDILLHYVIKSKDGKRVFPFRLSNKRLYTPDGTIRLMEHADGDGDHTAFMGDMLDTISGAIASRLVDRDMRLVNMDRDPAEFIRDAVGWQLQNLTDGVERFGFFREEFGSLRHKTDGGASSHFLIDLNHYQVDEGGHVVPDVCKRVLIPENLPKDTYAIYHSHVGAYDDPSHPDIELMLARNDPSIIIATPTERRGQGRYKVTEWKPKDATRMVEELERLKRTMTPNEFGQLDGTAMEDFTAMHLERHEFILDRGAGGAALKRGSA